MLPALGIKKKRGFSQHNDSISDAKKNGNNNMKDHNFGKADLFDQTSRAISKKFRSENISESSQVGIRQNYTKKPHNLLSFPNFLLESKHSEVRSRNIDNSLEFSEELLNMKQNLSKKCSSTKIFNAQKVITGYQDWVTTEDMLKSKSLAETTLDKLNASKNKMSFINQIPRINPMDLDKCNYHDSSSLENDKSKFIKALLLQSKNISDFSPKKNHFQICNKHGCGRIFASCKKFSDSRQRAPADQRQIGQLDSEEIYRTNSMDNEDFIAHSNWGKNKSEIDTAIKNNKISRGLKEGAYNLIRDKTEKSGVVEEKPHSLKGDDVLLQVNRSQINPQASHNTGEYSDDDFDEGIDDIDFLTIVTDTVLPTHDHMVVDLKNDKESGSNLKNKLTDLEILEQNCKVSQPSGCIHSSKIVLECLYSSHSLSKNEVTREDLKDGVRKDFPNEDSSIPLYCRLELEKLSSIGFDPQSLEEDKAQAALFILSEVREELASSRDPVEMKLTPSQKGFNSSQIAESIDKGSRTQINLGLEPKQDQAHEATSISSPIQISIIDDSKEFHDPGPFARPEYPQLVGESSPIIGLSSDHVFRTCFRIGEMFNEARRFSALKQAPVIELFARVTHSNRDYATTRQFFRFVDLWNIHPPFPTGLLANFKVTKLVDAESRYFIDNEEKVLTRALGILKKDIEQSIGWIFYIINIRKTDWEEINWTKKIISASILKSKENR
ncbi:hypothetical protein K3495_g7673 [Podosphaera aphanis]|nr:hypothetical protein K3495_g7673 [Podosphaera aphanis]